MTISSKSYISATLLGAALIFVPSIQAQETEDVPAEDTAAESAPVEWVSKQFMVSFSGNGVKKDARNKGYSVDTIYTNAVDQPGNVAISCVNGVQSLNVAAKPTDFETMIDKGLTSRRAKSRIPTVHIAGEKQDPLVWRYVQRFKLLIPSKEIMSKKVYNAAIRGDDVSVKLDLGDEINLVLPKPNKAFAEWGAECGIGRLASKE